MMRKTLHRTMSFITLLLYLLLVEIGVPFRVLSARPINIITRGGGCACEEQKTCRKKREGVLFCSVVVIIINPVGGYASLETTTFIIKTPRKPSLHPQRKDLSFRDGGLTRQLFLPLFGYLRGLIVFSSLSIIRHFRHQTDPAKLLCTVG